MRAEYRAAKPSQEKRFPSHQKLLKVDTAGRKAILAGMETFYFQLSTSTACQVTVVPTCVPVTSTRSPLLTVLKNVELSLMPSPIKLVREVASTVTPRTVKLWPGTMLSMGP